MKKFAVVLTVVQSYSAFAPLFMKSASMSQTLTIAFGSVVVGAVILGLVWLLRQRRSGYATAAPSMGRAVLSVSIFVVLIAFTISGRMPAFWYSGLGIVNATPLVKFPGYGCSGSDHCASGPANSGFFQIAGSARDWKVFETVICPAPGLPGVKVGDHLHLGGKIYNCDATAGGWKLSTVDR